MSGMKAAGTRRALLIFVDGVGIGRIDEHVNPVSAGNLPFLASALGGMPSIRNASMCGPLAVCGPASATLGVAGLPQSGTGQSALLTGINCPRLIGQHFGPYLYSTLKPVVERESIFARLVRAGISPGDLALANAFPRKFFEYLEHPRKRDIPGVYAAVKAGVELRGIEHYRGGDAISTDTVGVRWRDLGHPDAPVTTSYEAGAILAGIAARHRFTLFEYFDTDKAGHERSRDLARLTLGRVDELLHGVAENMPPGLLVCLASDHGNIEDLSTRSHTRNRVPVVLIGNGSDSIEPVPGRIDGIAAALVRFITSADAMPRGERPQA
jgi:hypothetical protein